MSILEKLAGAKALIEGAIEEELARSDPAPLQPATDCKHPNRQETTGAGTTRTRMACPDCGETWEVD